MLLFLNYNFIYVYNMVYVYNWKFCYLNLVVFVEIRFVCVCDWTVVIWMVVLVFGMVLYLLVVNFSVVITDAYDIKR